MKTVLVSLLLLTTVLGASGAALAATAPAPASDAACDIKQPVPCAIWVLRCVGDALNGAACHGMATTAGAPSTPCDDPLTNGRACEEYVIGCARGVMDGEVCGFATLGIAPRDVVACVGSFAQALLGGNPFEPCAV